MDSTQAIRAEDRSRYSRLLVGVLVLHSVLLISPILYALGFRGVFVIPVTIAAFIAVLALWKRRVPPLLFLLVIASLATSCVSGVYWESWRVALLPAFFGVSLLTAGIATRAELQKVVATGSFILFLMLVGGWIAAILAFAGVSPLGEISGLHGRPLYAYYTTITPTVIGNFIRPAGIYDEPGALSFVVCSFAFFRHSLGMDRKITWAMLLLGFVTFSLAHLVYVAIHFASERKVLVAWGYLILVTSVSIAALAASGMWEHFDARLVARLSTTSDPDKLVSGDNRTEAMIQAYRSIAEGGSAILLFGVDVACIEGSTACRNRYEVMGHNPLSPLAYYGLFISWPYYLLLVICIASGALRRSSWPLLALGLLFMQRPTALSIGYSMLGALALVSVLRAPLRRDVPFRGLTSGSATKGVPALEFRDSR